AISVGLGLADPDSNPSTLLLSASSSNQAIIPNGNIVFAGSNLSRSMQITPAADQSGTATITVTLSDGTDSVNRSFLVTVNPVNDLPTLNALSDLNITEDAGLQTVPLTGITSGAANENQTLIV